MRLIVDDEDLRHALYIAQPMDPWIASALGGGGGLLAGAALGWLLRRPGPERAPEGEAAEELLEETPVAFLREMYDLPPLDE